MRLKTHYTMDKCICCDLLHSALSVRLLATLWNCSFAHYHVIVHGHSLEIRICTVPVQIHGTNLQEQNTTESRSPFLFY